MPATITGIVLLPILLEQALSLRDCVRRFYRHFCAEFQFDSNIQCTKYTNAEPSHSNIPRHGVQSVRNSQLQLDTSAQIVFDLILQLKEGFLVVAGDNSSPGSCFQSLQSLGALEPSWVVAEESQLRLLRSLMLHGNHTAP